MTGYHEQMSQGLLNNCWISPAGEIKAVDWHQHGPVANEIMGTDHSADLAIHLLVKEGWLHIGQSGFISDRPVSDITDGQYNALLRLADQVTSLIIHESIVSYLHSGE